MSTVNGVEHYVNGVNGTDIVADAAARPPPMHRLRHTAAAPVAANAATLPTRGPGPGASRGPCRLRKILPPSPLQEGQPAYAGEDNPRNHKTPIWLPSARALVDTATGLQFLFLAYPDGRLHPAQDVTHRASTTPYYGDDEPPRLPH